MKFKTKFLISILVFIHVAKGCTWTRGQSCYDLVLDQQLSFYEADEFCRLSNGHLAAVESPEEDDFLRVRLLYHHGLIMEEGKTEIYYWIGGI